MKTKKILFAVFALVCVMAVSVSLASCSSSDDEGTVYYMMGFDSASYSGIDISWMKEEWALIENTFMKELGVTTNTFENYPGGDDAVKSKCEQAATYLNTYEFVGSYVFVVSRASGKGTSTIYSWGNLK